MYNNDVVVGNLSTFSMILPCTTNLQIMKFPIDTEILIIENVPITRKHHIIENSIAPRNTFQTSNIPHPTVRIIMTSLIAVNMSNAIEKKEHTEQKDANL